MLTRQPPPTPGSQPRTRKKKIYLGGDQWERMADDLTEELFPNLEKQLPAGVDLYSITESLLSLFILV